MKFFSKLPVTLSNFSQRWVPGSFVIALILTITTFVLALTVAQQPLLKCVQFWGDGLWELLSFAMQMCLIILTGYIVASSPLVNRILQGLAGLAKGSKSAIFLMTASSLILAWFHWGLSMIGAAILVRHLAARQLKIDYRLLVACAYLGMGCTWHAGLSASAPVLVATPGHFLESQIGIIPTTQTIFSGFNLILVGIVFLSLCFFTPLLHPASDQTRTVAPALLQSFQPTQNVKPVRSNSFSDWLENSRLINIVFFLVGLVWLIIYFSQGSSDITLNVLNFAFLFLGILLHGTPARFLRAAEAGGKLIFGVVIQFPFYAGMYGLIKSSGLATIVGNWFVSISTQHTFPTIVYWYSGLVNYFVPSGGAKWAIEAPYILAAAKSLGVPAHTVVVSYAWGDMATDLIQPFWAIPLLTVAKLEFKDIMGFEIIIFGMYVLLVSLAFLLFPF